MGSLQVNSMASDPWLGDWQQRIYDRVNELGYNDVSTFAATMPGAPFRELASALGDNIAPVQLEKMLRVEAVAVSDFKTFARDCLVRYLNQYLPMGWGVGDGVEFDTARAFASWSAALSLDENPRLDSLTRGIWNELHRVAPIGWRTVDVNDPVLLKAFESTSF